MAKTRGVEAKLSRLRELRKEIAAPEHLAELRRALGDKSNLVAADAAEIVGVRGLSDLAPDLVETFARFMIEPGETDPQCRAKLAIVEALIKMEYDHEEVFLAGIRHVQMEAVWGGKEDSAAALRANSAVGLVNMNYHGVVLLLAELLADKQNVARVGAARALGATGAASALPLLRYKAIFGDSDAAVTAECLAALMTAAPKESLDFVAGFLNAPHDAVQEGAAFALGESRRPDAFDILKAHWPKTWNAAMQEVLLLAISMTRLPAALDLLLDVLAADNPTASLAALSALAIHRHYEPIKERIAAAVAKKGDAVLLERFKEKFEA